MGGGGGVVRSSLPVWIGLGDDGDSKAAYLHIYQRHPDGLYSVSHIQVAYADIVLHALVHKASRGLRPVIRACWLEHGRAIIKM